MPFQITRNPATIKKLGIRIEHHGDDRQLAADIHFVLSTSNTVLDQFDKELRKSLFRKPTKGEQQSLPTIGDVLTEIKIPSLEPVKTGHEFAGCELQIDGELESTQPTFLVDVKLKKFVMAAKEGGSVELGFTAQANVTPEEAAELTEALLRGDVIVTVSPGKANEATQQEDLAA